MAFDPISVGLQGVMGAAGSYQSAQNARTNAAISRRWAEYSEKRSESERKTIWGQFQQDKELQIINNAATQGSVQAAAGASGVVTSGGILDIMADSIDSGIAAIQMMRSSALRAVANVTNTGNSEVYKYQTEAMTWEQRANQAESMAMLYLIGGGIGAAAAAGAFVGDPGDLDEVTQPTYGFGGSHTISGGTPFGAGGGGRPGGGFSGSGGGGYDFGGWKAGKIQ